MLVASRFTVVYPAVMGAQWAESFSSAADSAFGMSGRCVAIGFGIFGGEDGQVSV